MTTQPAPDDTAWMRRALALAAAALNRTSPNPRVGCVLVRDGQLLGEGATQPPGGPHAEVMALRDAQARGHDLTSATAYVTLEPCNHHGRTPPCVDALLAAGVRRVVAALADPFPAVNGQGLARLRANGVEVSCGLLHDEALQVNAGFVSRVVRGLPWTRLKLAGSLDGRSALLNGVSQWITGPAARADGHAFRSQACVVLTGIGTVLADDPALTVRDAPVQRQPRRAVLDSQLRLPLTARLLDSGDTLVFTASTDSSRIAALQAKSAEVVTLADANGRVDLPAVLRWLGLHGINEVHVEAGATLNGALLEADLIDELLVYQAPMLLGPGAALATLPARTSLPASPTFQNFETSLLGADVRLRARHQAAWAQLSRATRQITG